MKQFMAILAEFLLLLWADILQLTNLLDEVYDYISGYAISFF
jgi:hypothetical protein